MKLYLNNKIKLETEKLNKALNLNKDFTWHYLYIFHYLKTYKFINSKFKDEEYIPVNIKKLRTVISYDKASKLLKDLVDCGMLFSDCCYTIGLKSKCYKIHPELDTEDWFYMEIEDKKLNEKISNISFEESIFFEDKSSYGKVTNNMFKLKINHVESLKFIEESDSNEDKKKQHKLSVELFDRKFSKIVQTTNRLHNNLTNLPKELRQFLTVNGESLWQVDIKCSQPTFLGLYMLKNNLGDREEVINFLEKCKEGSFYNLFGEGDRKELKEKVFSSCFFNKVRNNLNCFEKKFSKLFPTVFECVVDLKKNDYRNLAIMLQNVESEYIFEVVSELNCYILTIHDSLVSTKDNIKTVEETMKAIFIKKFNFIPKLEAEKC